MWSEEITRQICTTAETLLRERRVDLVIGYQAGSTPLRTTPCFVRRAEYASSLIWTPFCENNLSVYINEKSGRIGLLAKGCDARAAVVALQENRIKRDYLTIIGLPCSGIVDRKKLDQAFDLETIRDFSYDKDYLVLQCKEEVRVPFSQVLDTSCITCSSRNAPVADIVIGTKKGPEPDIQDQFAAIEAFEAKSPQVRWSFFKELAHKCIRCYACRGACPLCYCQDCIVDQTQPQWFGKTTDEEDVLAYHIMRAFHVAGRCVECGACSRACPMGIDLRILNKKLQKDIRELYYYIPGMNPEDVPVFGAYKVDDPQECITEK